MSKYWHFAWTVAKERSKIVGVEKVIASLVAALAAVIQGASGNASLTRPILAGLAAGATVYLGIYLIQFSWHFLVRAPLLIFGELQTLKTTQNTERKELIKAWRRMVTDVYRVCGSSKNTAEIEIALGGHEAYPSFLPFESAGPMRTTRGPEQPENPMPWRLQRILIDIETQESDWGLRE